MTKATAEWVQKAEDDWIAANQLNQGSNRLYDQVGFHCQQSAEKYLKAILQELAHTIPRTHDLKILLDLLVPHHPSLRSLRRFPHHVCRGNAIPWGESDAKPWRPSGGPTARERRPAAYSAFARNQRATTSRD